MSGVFYCLLVENSVSSFTDCIIVGIGGFFGANTRYFIGKEALRRYGDAFPVGTLFINVTGSFLMGVFATIITLQHWESWTKSLITVGILGAYTTYSTFEYETFALVQRGAFQKAAFNFFLSLLLGFTALLLGVFVAKVIYHAA